jgi:uncharacterized Zn finger protein
MIRATTDPPPIHIIKCPVCQAQGETLRHDIRNSLLYFCQRCHHEWQIDVSEEPLDVDLAVSPGPLVGET